MDMDTTAMDLADPLAWTRDQFELPLRADMGGRGNEQSGGFDSTSLKAENRPPTSGDGPSVYLCGNSLGLMPKNAKKLMLEELDVWSRRLVICEVNSWFPV